MKMRFQVTAIIGAVAALWLAQTASGNAYTYKVIYNFCSERGCADGDGPTPGLTMDAAGNVYGASSANSDTGVGTIFELSPSSNKSGWRYQKLKSLPTANGYFIFDVNGNMYGTAQGGSKGNGMVFELLKNGDQHPTFKELISFSYGDPNGWNPRGLTYQGASTGALYDGVSSLFGTNGRGGASCDCGVAYALTPTGDTWTESVLYTFCPQGTCTDGAYPGPVAMDGEGNLFGSAVTFSKKSKPRSIAFELQNNGGTWSETILHTFCVLHKCADGIYWSSTPFFDTDGNLLGTTSKGGDGHKDCCGLLFQLTPQGENSPYTILTSFCEKHDCVDGAQPQTDIVIDASKNVFGATATGGRYRNDYQHLGGGTVYEWNGTTLETLYSFCELKNCTDGEYPMSGLVMDASGNLFGATQSGGKYGAGVVFELSP